MLKHFVGMQKHFHTYTHIYTHYLTHSLYSQVSMTESTARLVMHILRDEIPSMWCGEENHDNTMTLDVWYANLLRRTHQLHSWSNTLERPITVWFGGLYFPRAYLNAAKRCVCRNAKLSMERTEFVSHVTTNQFASRHPYRGMYLSGLSLRGAMWDSPGGKRKKKKQQGLGAVVLLHETIPCGGKLVRFGANTFDEESLHMDIPTLYLELCEFGGNGEEDEDHEKDVVKENSSSSSKSNNKNQYECPVYRNDSVGDSEFSVMLTAPDPQVEWIQGGVHAILH